MSDSFDGAVIKPGDQYDFHPLCKAYTAYSEDDYATRLQRYRDNPGLANDQVVDLVEDEDGTLMILDGRHHYLICQELGYTTRYRIFEGTPQEEAAFVDARNGDRRHMTAAQRAITHAKREEYLKARGVRGPTGREDRSVISPEEVGVNPRLAARANNVVAHAPELVDSVMNGDIGLVDAEKIAKLPEESRQKVVDKVVKSDATNKKVVAKTALESAKKPNHDSDDNPIRPDLSQDGDKDGWGIPIQDHAEDAFNSVELFDNLLRQLKQCQKALTAVADSPGGVLLQKEVQWVQRGKDDGRWSLAYLDNAIKTISNAKPFLTDCPYVYNRDTKHTDKCPLCRGTRIVGSIRGHQISDELKSAVLTHYGLTEET